MIIAHTCVRASDKTRPHGDVLVPLCWVEANVTSDEWRAEVVITFGVTVTVGAKLLRESRAMQQVSKQVSII